MEEKDPLTYKQIREILAYIQRVHHEAAKCCMEISSDAGERPRLMADLFRQHEETLEQHLKSLEKEPCRSILDMWVQYVPVREIEKKLNAFRSENIRSAHSIETLNRCIELQQEIVECFRQMVESKETHRAEAFLGKIYDFEESILKKMSMASTMQQDA